MYVLPTIEEARVSPDWFGFDDDFLYNVTADLWTTVATDSGSFAVGDAKGGVAVVTPSDGTVADNDETYAKNTHEIFKIAAAKPFFLEALVQFAQAATNKANHAVGLKNAVAANSILDDGAGLATNFSGAAFYCVDGDTTWRVIYSDGTTQTIVELDADGSLDGVAKTAASTLFQLLRIEIIPVTSALVDVMFYIDGVLVCKMKEKTFASATEAQCFLGTKQGADTTLETLKCDRFAAYQKR